MNRLSVESVESVESAKPVESVSAAELSVISAVSSYPAAVGSEHENNTVNKKCIYYVSHMIPLRNYFSTDIRHDLCQPNKQLIFFK